MIDRKPPRDWFSTLAGVTAVLAVAGGLAYAFAGPAVRLMSRPWQEVWVTIVQPAPPPAPANPHRT